MKDNWHLNIGNKNREEIILAGKELFFKNTIFNVKITDICALARVSRVTFYKYFKSMDELIFEIQMNILDNMKQFINMKSDININGKESLKKVLYTFIDFAKEHKEEMKFIISFDIYYCSYNLNEDLKLSYKSFIVEDYNGSFIKNALDRGIKDGSLKGDMKPLKAGTFIHQTIMGLLQRMTYTDFIMEYEEITFDEIAIEAVELIVRYLESIENSN